MTVDKTKITVLPPGKAVGYDPDDARAKRCALREHTAHDLERLRREDAAAPVDPNNHADDGRGER